jgi:hypothetical protein
MPAKAWETMRTSKWVSPGPVPGAGVTGVPPALVRDRQFDRREGLGQLVADRFGDNAHFDRPVNS